MTRHIILLPVMALLPFIASAQDKCFALGEAEQNRILREFSGQAPSKTDQEAYRDWYKRLNAALADSARLHEDCVRADRAAMAPATLAREKECIAESNRRADEFEKRYRGRTLTAQEQATRRAEEQRLIDERMSCTNRGNRNP